MTWSRVCEVDSLAVDRGAAALVDGHQVAIFRLASGEVLGAWGLTEPGSGSDAAALRTRAREQGDGWVLNGSKAFITNASVAETTVVMARSEPHEGARGISAFILEKGMAGFRPGKKENKLGCRASDTSEVVMEDCRVLASNLLGEEGMGFVDAMKVLDGGRISIAALGVGMAQGAFEASLRYAKERRQFDQPIASFQAIQWYLADMATRIEAARLLTYRAAWRRDVQKLPATREAAIAQDSLLRDRSKLIERSVTLRPHLRRNRVRRCRQRDRALRGDHGGERLVAGHRAAGVEQFAGAALPDDARQDGAGAHVAAGEPYPDEEERDLRRGRAVAQVRGHGEDRARRRVSHGERRGGGFGGGR